MKALATLAILALAIAGCSYHEDTVVRPVPSTAAVVVPDAPPPTRTVVVPD
jgi:PBP1b-binding outer membrane lipoprotein LpoB